MKSILLIYLFLGVFSARTLAQVGNSIPGAIASKNFALKPLVIWDYTRDKVDTLVGFNQKTLMAPNYSGLDFNSGKSKIVIGDLCRNIDNMPIVVPKGSFALKIQKPDSTVNYTLLIRK
jgi:hypothetical protein